MFGINRAGRCRRNRYMRCGMGEKSWGKNSFLGMRGFFNANRNAGLENKVKKAIVDDSKCLSCGACIEVCPRGAIKLKDKAVVNYEKCVGCGYCVVRCPAKAISLK